MTRLLQAMAGAPHGGAEAFFSRLTLALQEDGQEQHVAIRNDAARAAELRDGGVEVDELPFGGFFDFSTRLGLRKLARDFQPRVVLSWMSRATRFVPRGPYVFAARLGGYYDLKYYRHCDHLIGNTKGIVAWLREQGWPAAKTHYLPNFVEETVAEPIARSLFDTPDDALLLLALGRLHANKGFDVLISALAQLPDAVLWLAGEGPERAALVALAEKLGVSQRLRLLGWRKDAAALMATADLLVCPSRLEPLGNVVLEGWAQGLPVVAAASAGPVELIRPGEDGLLVPIEDADALARVILDLDRDPARRYALAEAGRASYRTRFSRAAAVAQYRGFFAEVAR